MKKRVITLCMMLLLLLVMIGCGDSSVEEMDWVNIRLGDALPEPKSKSMKILTNSDESLSVYICNISQNDYYEYTRLCEDNGFSIDVEYIGDSFYGFNEEGYYLSLSYYGSNKEMHISLDEPIKFDEYTWPVFALELGLPQPVSSKGAYNWEDTDRFSLNVGDTSYEEYSAYVDICTNAGFTIDSSKGEKSFYGDNEQGYHINVSYKGFNTMVIWLEAPKETNDGENAADCDIALPCSDSSYLWTDYQDIVEDFEEAGFTNITTVPLGDLSEDDWFTSEGEYKSVTVGGKAEFNKGDKHPADVEIVITYHSYPENYEDKQDDATPTPSPKNEIVVTKNEEDFIGLHYSEVEELLRNMGFDDISFNSTYSTNQEYTNGEVYTVYIRDGLFDLGGFKKGDSFSEKAEVTIHYYEVEEVKPNLTTANCQELVKLLQLTDPNDASVRTFVNTYEGRTVEFDGCVVVMMQHEEYETRFDVCLVSGDYDTNRVISGPIFAFENVNFYDMHVSGTDTVAAEMNFHIEAEIEGFSEEGSYIILKPVSITYRGIASEYEKAFVRELNGYNLYYMFDTDDNKVIYFGTNDTYIDRGTYEGSFSSGVTIEWSHGEWKEKFIHTGGSKAVLVDGNGFEWEYKTCDVSDAQVVLSGME